MVLSLPARRSQLLSQAAGVALYLSNIGFKSSYVDPSLIFFYELQNLRRNKVFYGVRCYSLNFSLKVVRRKRIMAFKSTEFQILALITWGGRYFGLNFEFYCIFDP